MTEQSKVSFHIEGTLSTTEGSSSIYIPTLEYIPGLDPLIDIDKVFIVEEPVLNPQARFPVRRHLKIFNENGETIFKVIQLDPPCRQRKFVMYILDVKSSEPIIKIIQRCPYRSEDADLAEITPYLDQDELIQKGQNAGGSWCCRSPSLKASVHVAHMEKGIMGSIVNEGSCYQIYDRYLRAIWTIPIKLPRFPEEELRATRRKIDCCSGRRNFYEYFVAVNSEFVLPELPLGMISTGLEDLPKGLDDSKTGPVVSASFPAKFTPFEKCLIVAFALSMYCRKDSLLEKYRPLHLKVFVLVFVLIIVVVGVGVGCKISHNHACQFF